MSKVLLINGSPHAHGCTFTALSVVAGVLEQNGRSSDLAGFAIGSQVVMDGGYTII